MKIQGEHTFDAPRERVWRALLDPGVLARVLPGTERLEQTGDNEYRGAMNVQVGPVKGQFQGTLRLSDLVPLEGYRMQLDGSGPTGFMKGEGTIKLADVVAGSAGSGGTTLAYDLDAQVGGRLAGVGQRLLESSARSITRQGLEGLARELQSIPDLQDGPAAETPAPAVAPAPPPPAPTQTQVAARVAADVARDLVPPEKRSWLWAGAGVVVLVVLFLLARSCG